MCGEQAGILGARSLTHDLGKEDYTMFIDDNAKEIVNKVLDIAKAGIIEVYQEVQKVAPELWKLVVRQVMIDGIECFICAFFALMMFAYGILAIKYAASDESYGDSDEFFGVTGTIAFLLSLVLIPVFLINGLDYFLNPSYWALKDILSMVKH